MYPNTRARVLVVQFTYAHLMTNCIKSYLDLCDDVKLYYANKEEYGNYNDKILLDLLSDIHLNIPKYNIEMEEIWIDALSTKKQDIMLRCIMCAVLSEAKLNVTPIKVVAQEYMKIAGMFFEVSICKCINAMIDKVVQKNL